MHLLKDMHNSNMPYGTCLLGTNLCIYSEFAFQTLKDMYNNTMAYGTCLLGTNLYIYSEFAFPALDLSSPCNHGAPSSIVFECFLHYL